MLHRFIEQHAEEIAARARATMALRTAPRPTASELTHGVLLFLRELLQRLRNHEDPDAVQIGASATLHGGELLAAGFTIGQVVYGYGDVCQAVTGLMVGIMGSTGRMLGNSLLAMNDLVTRSLADVRIDSGVTNSDRIVVADLFADVSIAAALKARSRDIRRGRRFHAKHGQTCLHRRCG